MKRARRLLDIPSYPFARWGQHVAAVQRQGFGVSHLHCAQAQVAQPNGLDVIRMDIGNPDLPPPAEVIAALCQSAQQSERHGYPGYRGLPALREAIAAYYGRRFGVTLDPEREVVPLIGSKEGIANLALACLDPGDLVLAPDPGYAAYAIGAQLAGAHVYPMPLRAENNFLPDLDAIPPDVAGAGRFDVAQLPQQSHGRDGRSGFFCPGSGFCAPPRPIAVPRRALLRCDV